MAVKRRGEAGWAVHPGEILEEEFLKPMKITRYALAKAIGVNPQAVNPIAMKKRGISADMALRFAAFFGTSAEFWMNLQSAYELASARKHLAQAVKKIKPVAKVA
jgi:antitoxin HigA-1